MEIGEGKGGEKTEEMNLVGRIKLIGRQDRGGEKTEDYKFF